MTLWESVFFISCKNFLKDGPFNTRQMKSDLRLMLSRCFIMTKI